MGKIWLAVAIFSAAAPAWAQNAEQVTAAVGVQMDSYKACLRQHVVASATSVKTKKELLTLAVEDKIFTEAIASCRNEKQDLLDHLQMAPIGASSDVARSSVQSFDEMLRPQMTQTMRAAWAS